MGLAVKSVLYSSCFCSTFCSVFNVSNGGILASVLFLFFVLCKGGFWGVANVAIWRHFWVACCFDFMSVIIQ